MLTLQSAVDSDQDSVSPRSLQLQNRERAYRQNLQAYEEAQQKQAQLVEKLQTKVSRAEVTRKRLVCFMLPFCVTSGSSVQEEVWGAGRAGAGENLRV